MKFVAFIDKASRLRPARVHDKQLFSRASVTQIAEYGHAWLIDGAVTENEVKRMFNRDHSKVLVYEAYTVPKNPLEAPISTEQTDIDTQDLSEIQYSAGSFSTEDTESQS